MLSELNELDERLAKHFENLASQARKGLIGGIVSVVMDHKEHAFVTMLMGDISLARWTGELHMMQHEILLDWHAHRKKDFQNG